MSIMSGRFEGLLNAIIGYEKTGLQLIGYNGKIFFPSAISDDIGLFFFVPKLVRMFDISLENAIFLFFYGMVVVSFFLGLLGFFLLNKSWLFRIFATVVLFLFYFFACRGITDVYLVQSSVAIATVPLLLYFIKKNKTNFLFYTFLFLSGILVGYSHYIRAFSSVAVVLFFFITLFFLLKCTWKKKSILFIVFFVGTVIPSIHINFVLKQRKNYFGAKNQIFESRHVFWHSLYGGFGFLSNNLGLAWDDRIIVENVKKTHPNVVYPTKAYEQATKAEVFNLVKYNSRFVLHTLFAKFGIILFYFLLFANIGLLAAYFYKKQFMLDFAFFVAISFNSLFGFIALPGRYYLLGMFAFAVLYNLVSFEHALAQGAMQDLFQWSKKLWIKLLKRMR